MLQWSLDVKSRMGLGTGLGTQLGAAMLQWSLDVKSRMGADSMRRFMAGLTASMEPRRKVEDGAPRRGFFGIGNGGFNGAST